MTSEEIANLSLLDKDQIDRALAVSARLEIEASSSWRSTGGQPHRRDRLSNARVDHMRKANGTMVCGVFSNLEKAKLDDAEPTDSTRSVALMRAFAKRCHVAYAHHSSGAMQLVDAKLFAPPKEVLRPP